MNASTDLEAARLRAAMVDSLIAANTITSKRVEAAMRRVPRHVFTPGADLTAAYADDVVRYERDANGQCVSSVSAPWIVARMLQDARIGSGMKVLEIGAGGYNAALLSYLVGPRGRVVSIDIDVKVTSRAMAALARTEYAPYVAVADGAYGLARFAPYDRILVTAAARDVPRAWADQLVAGGRLVVPLVLRGQQRIVTFVKQGGLLRSTGMFYGGFVPMRGAAISRPQQIALVAGGMLEFDGALPPDALELATIPVRPPVEVATGVVVGSGEPFDALQLYLAIALSRCAYLTPGAAWRLALPQPGCPVLAAGDGTVAYLTVRKVSGGLDAGYEFVAVGLGPAAASAAAEMADHIGLWDSRYRVSGVAQTTAYPGGTPVDSCEGEYVLECGQSALAVSFPDVGSYPGR